MSKTWTTFKLTDNMLKQLSIGYQKWVNREADPTCRPGRGFGASAGRYGLYNRGLIDIDDVISFDGVQAFQNARKEGW